MSEHRNGAHPFPKLLVMSRRIPPAVTGSAVIVGNLAKQFTRDEMVIVGEREIGAPEVKWSQAWPRLNYAWGWGEHWRGERYTRWPVFPWVVLYSIWVVLAQRCRAVLVVYPGEVYLLAAYLVAKITRRPLYAYFHNTYLENIRPGGFSHQLAKWLQPRVFREARHIFVMSEGMQQLYRRRYPDLVCSPLVHTFNDALPVLDDLPPLHDPLRLCFSGTVNASCADAASRLAQLVQQADGVQMTLYSGTPQGALARLGFNGPKVSIDTVSRDRLLERLRAADILLLPHGFTSPWAQEEIQTIFPTKVIEYLISGRPILAHLPADCFLADFLRRHECALIVDTPDVAALRQALDRLRQDEGLRRNLVRRALEASRQFYAPEVARQLREAICATQTNGHHAQPN